MPRTFVRLFSKSDLTIREFAIFFFLFFRIVFVVLLFLTDCWGEREAWCSFLVGWTELEEETKTTTTQKTLLHLPPKTNKQSNNKEGEEYKNGPSLSYACLPLMSLSSLSFSKERQLLNHIWHLLLGSRELSARWAVLCCAFVVTWTKSPLTSSLSN